MAKKRRKRIASRGSVNTNILKTLVDGDKYGYEIIKEVQENSDGKIILKQPSLYSSLGRFEEKGYVVSYWGDSDIGGRRHYYHLTTKGHIYYQKEVLKLGDDEIEEYEDNFVPPTQEKPVLDTYTPPIKRQPVTIKEIDSNSIPAIVDFEDKEKSNIIPDHQFLSTTPIETYTNNNLESINKDSILTSNTVENNEPWKEFSNKVTSYNLKRASTPNKKLHCIKPKKHSKVVLDVDGIYKLRDEDYVPKKVQHKVHIVDNVIKRRTDVMYGYTQFADNVNKKSNQQNELTDEEKRIKNATFLERFNSLTQSKIDSNKISKEENIDYQNKLNALYSLSTNADEIIKPKPPVQTQNYENTKNNLFNYVEEESKELDTETSQPAIEEKEDSFIDFEPVEFNTTNEVENYIDSIDTIADNNQIKMTKYETKPASRNNKSYVLINKAKFVFGLILGFILLSELTISLFIFKKYELFYQGDNILYIVAYIFSTILILSYILPFILNPRHHKPNNFKLRFAWMFGILTFIVSLILFYCINALLGLNIENIRYFIIKLVVPIILSFNFVICPPIYYSIINSKKFYD